MKSIFNTPLKAAPKQLDWCETVETLGGNDENSKIWPICGPKLARYNQAPRKLRKLFDKHLQKYLQQVCKSSFVWIKWKFFQKIFGNLHCYPFSPNFDLFGRPKWPKNRASEAHILHISKINPNKHVKQDWCEFSGNFFDKIVKNLNFYLFGGLYWPDNLGLSGLSFTHIQK